MARKLPRSFYAQPCLVVAQALIGKYLVHQIGDKMLTGRIVETEAYVGEEDQACHARFGRTVRSNILFGPPGYSYIFMIYGMYHCLNVVTEAENCPSAVLIRAVEPGPQIEGQTDGPGKLCRAFHLTRLHNNLDLVTSSSLFIEDRGELTAAIVATARIGIDYAGEWAEKPWRFVDQNSHYLSKKLP